MYYLYSCWLYMILEKPFDIIFKFQFKDSKMSWCNNQAKSNNIFTLNSYRCTHLNHIFKAVKICFTVQQLIKSTQITIKITFEVVLNDILQGKM